MRVSKNEHKYPADSVFSILIYLEMGLKIVTDKNDKNYLNIIVIYQKLIIFDLKIDLKRSVSKPVLCAGMPWDPSDLRSEPYYVASGSLSK